MKKLLFVFVLFSCSAFAQNSRFDGVVQARSGLPAPGAKVAVCIHPCTVPANVSISNPPSVLVPLCSSHTDAVCTQPNPVTADGLGNYGFYVTPGRYDLVFYGSGLTAKTLSDQILPCDPGNCAISGGTMTLTALTVTGASTLSSITSAPFTGPSPWYDVTAPAYGASTGLTNNATAFQAAITAATANGGTVFVPCGIYPFTASIALATGVRLRGSQKNCAILNFTGATNGVTIADGLHDFGIEDLTIQTSNATAGKAIVANGSVSGVTFFRIANVGITQSGSGRWTHGFYCSFCEVATVSDLKVFGSATIGYYLVTNSNQLNIINPEVTGGGIADLTFNRGLWIDTPGTDGPNIFGGTFQGCFSIGSAVFISGHTPRFYGLHAEGTCASADGGDLVISGTSGVQVFGGQVVQQTILTGTIRGFLSSGVNHEGAVTIGATVQGASFRDGRAFSITDNGTVGNATNNGNSWTNMISSSGSLYRDKGVVEKDNGSSSSTANFPASAAVAYPNNTEIYFRDSGGTNQPTLFVTAADGWFLQYKATNSLVVRNSTPTTIATFSDTGLVASALDNTPIGGATPAAGTFTTLTANTALQLTTGTISRHATFAGALGCTTAAAVGATCTSAALNWSSTLGDTSYFASCDFDGATTGVPVVVSITKTSATQFTATVAALTAVGATGSIVCNAWHN